MIVIEFFFITGVIAVLAIAVTSAYKIGRKVQKDEDENS
jgi:hypothetical protein